MLIRTAQLEGSALLGLAILMMTALRGMLFTIDWIWLNVIPTAALILLIISTFPTEQKMLGIFESQLYKN